MTLPPEKPVQIQECFRYCSAEFVNRLIVVTYHTEIFISGCKNTYKFKLGRIGILILIHHNVTEPFLIRFQNLSAVLKQFYCFYESDRSNQRHCFFLMKSGIPDRSQQPFFIKSADVHQHFIRCNKLVFAWEIWARRERSLYFLVSTFSLLHTSFMRVFWSSVS
mgnify:CR=1 FL=1